MRTRHSLIAVAVGLSLCGTAVADPVLFDPDGTNSFDYTVPPGSIPPLGNNYSNTVRLVDELDWDAGSALAQGGNLAIANWLNNEDAGDAHGGADEQFSLYAHMKLSAAKLAGASTFIAGLDTKFEVTVVLGFTELISTVTADQASGLNTASFDFVDDGSTFFSIYFDDLTDAVGVKSNRLAGTGYADGELILDGIITGTDGGTFTVDTSQGTPDLDQTNDGDDWSGANGGAGQLTVEGSGSNEDINLGVDAGVAEWDEEFFLNELVEALLTNIDLTVPFGDDGVGTNNPSQVVSTTDNNTVNGGAAAQPGADQYTIYDGAGGNTTLGNTNGGISFVAGTGWVADGDDFLFGQDSNSSWGAETVPEPSLLALLGGGIAAFGFAAKRRRIKFS